MDASQRFHQIKQAHDIDAPFGLPEGSVDRAGFNVWARSRPKQDVFDRYLSLSDDLGLPLNVYVDDLCAQSVTGRSSDEQQEINTAYTEYFGKHVQDIIFSSETLAPLNFADFTTIADSITLHSFRKNILPAKKRDIPTATTAEFGHAVLQTAFLGQIAQKESLLLCGQFSMGIMYAAREIYSDFPKIITLKKDSE